VQESEFKGEDPQCSQSLIIRLSFLSGFVSGYVPYSSSQTDVSEACSSWFLPRIVGISKAVELVYTGRVFRAAEDATSGLFSYVVPREQVLSKATEIAAEMAENTSAVSVALSKALLWHGLMEDDPQSVHLTESRCFYSAGRQRDAYEGIQSFLDRRPPKFTMTVSTDMPDFFPWWKLPKV
jgi:1,4-dihydroxy-2-naphthoyl-CoA synthase